MVLMTSFLHKLAYSKANDTLILLLSVISLILLAYELAFPLTPPQINALNYLDLSISLFFLAEFSLRVSLARHKTHYALYHWADLISSIPISDGIFRSLRILRLMRLSRLTRLIRLPQTIISPQKIINHPHTLYYILSGYLFSLTLTSLIIWYKQLLPINTLSDAIIWSALTMFTLSYPEPTPTIGTVYILGFILITLGLIVVGSLITYLGNRTLRPLAVKFSP